MFVLQTAHLEDQSNVASLILGEEGVKCDIGGAVVHSMEVDPGVSQFDLSCMVSETEGDKLSIVCHMRVAIYAHPSCAVLRAWLPCGFVTLWNR
jgi:hypothetical protein